MALYEHVFLARQDISAQQVEQLVEQFKTIITNGGGSVGKVENWGLRTLAYRSEQEPQGALHADEHRRSASRGARRWSGRLRLNEDVLRFLTLKVEEHEEEQSAMMQKRDRDDRRRGRGDRFERDGGGRGGDRDRGPRRSDRDSEEKN